MFGGQQCDHLRLINDSLKQRVYNLTAVERTRIHGPAHFRFPAFELNVCLFIRLSSYSHRVPPGTAPPFLDPPSHHPGLIRSRTLFDMH